MHEIFSRFSWMLSFANQLSSMHRYGIHKHISFYVNDGWSITTVHSERKNWTNEQKRKTTRKIKEEIETNSVVCALNFDKVRNSATRTTNDSIIVVMKHQSRMEDAAKKEEKLQNDIVKFLLIFITLKCLRKKNGGQSTKKNSSQIFFVCLWIR